MSWQDVAYRNVYDATRSRLMWLVAGLLLITFVGYSVAHSFIGEESFTAFLDGIAGLIGIILPLLAILLGYKSIAHERSTGGIYLSLSLPHSRKDLVIGKFVGRSIVLLIPTLGALVVAGIVAAVRYGTDGALLFPWFLLATTLYALAFVGFAVGLSMSTTVDRWITIGALGGYAGLVLIWDNFHTATLLVLHRFDTGVLSNIPDWALLFRLIKPSESYYRLVRAGFDVERAGLYVGDGVPLYVGWWMALLLLAVWTLLPLALGFRRFRTADL